MAPEALDCSRTNMNETKPCDIRPKKSDFGTAVSVEEFCHFGSTVVVDMGICDRGIKVLL